MIWTQCGVCLVGWIAFGLILRTRSLAIANRLLEQPRAKRVVLGGVAMIGGMVFLLAGLSLIAAMGGLTAAGLKPWAWLTVFLTGLGFVFLQVLGAMTMVTLMQRETTSLPETSGPHESESVHEENSPR